MKSLKEITERYPVTWRTLNYWQSQGIFSKPHKKKGEKGNFYDIIHEKQIKDIIWFTRPLLSLKEYKRKKGA